MLRILIGKKQNVYTRQQNKQANKFFCENFVGMYAFLFRICILCLLLHFFLKKSMKIILKRFFHKLWKIIIVTFWRYVINPISYSISGMRFMRQEREYSVELVCGILAWPFCCYLCRQKQKILYCKKI